jgi:hypothetical protein
MVRDMFSRSVAETIVDPAGMELRSKAMRPRLSSGSSVLPVKKYCPLPVADRAVLALEEGVVLDRGESDGGGAGGPGGEDHRQRREPRPSTR